MEEMKQVRKKKPQAKRWRLSVEYMQPGETKSRTEEQRFNKMEQALTTYRRRLNKLWTGKNQGNGNFRIAVNWTHKLVWESPLQYHAEGVYASHQAENKVVGLNSTAHGKA